MTNVESFIIYIISNEEAFLQDFLVIPSTPYIVICLVCLNLPLHDSVSPVTKVINDVFYAVRIYTLVFRRFSYRDLFIF